MAGLSWSSAPVARGLEGSSRNSQYCKTASAAKQAAAIAALPDRRQCRGARPRRSLTDFSTAQLLSRAAGREGAPVRSDESARLLPRPERRAGHVQCVRQPKAGSPMRRLQWHTSALQRAKRRSVHDADVVCADQTWACLPVIPKHLSEFEERPCDPFHTLASSVFACCAKPLRADAGSHGRGRKTPGWTRPGPACEHVHTRGQSNAPSLLPVRGSAGHRSMEPVSSNRKSAGDIETCSGPAAMTAHPSSAHRKVCRGPRQSHQSRPRSAVLQLVIESVPRRTRHLRPVTTRSPWTSRSRRITM